MAEAPPIKNTVGEGFSTEELVVSSLACHLLSGLPWAGADGATVLSIECQTRQDGWFFDDAVVDVEKNGRKRACGCSIKSFALFTMSGAPRELAVALWQQWRAPAPSPFRPDQDSLILFVAQHEPDVREAWVGLTESARAIPPEVYGNRFATGAEPSPIRRDAFQSLRQGTPDRLEATPEETARLLRSLHLCEHDFHHNAAESATRAVTLCQQALSDGGRAHAAELWRAVIDCVAPIRRKGGKITLSVLLAELAHRFPLKHHPSYAADWAGLENEGRNRIEALPGRIGGAVSLGREELARNIAEQVENQRVTTLVGDSGNGKSVLARDWVRRSPGVALWLRASDLGAAGGIQAAFRLQHDGATLLNHSGQSGRLVFDGFDKCFDDAAFDEAARLLVAVTTGPAQNRWRTLITCCPEDWERIRRKLLQRGFVLSGRNVPVGRLTQAELREVATGLPLLTGLINRPHLVALLRWPKALDIVATYGRTIDSSEQWASESDFARWFWRSAICQEDSTSPRDRAARKLAVYLGDSMLAAASLEQFSTAEAEIFAGLARDGHVEIARDRNMVRFSHDLLGDWARLRELQIQPGNVAEFLQKRLYSPLWHRAVRYYALDLLEQHADAAPWRQLFEQFALNSTTDALAQNLLLEAPVFASDPYAVLNRLWPLLEADKGALLQRFLRQFLQVATQPDDHFLRHIEKEDPDLRLEIAARYRIPWPPYWYDVIRFLGQHGDQAIALAREEIADLCLLWLPLQRAIPGWMKTVATLAISAARRFYRSPLREQHQDHNDTSPEEKICQALLLATPIFPEAVKELVLKLSGRVAPAADEVLPKREFGRSRFFEEPREPKPWPEGPQVECSPAFREAFMNGQYAMALCGSLPEVAAEALLGVLLDLPLSGPPYDHGMGLDEHGFDRAWKLRKSSFWTNGPFVAFLNSSPDIALATIIRLVNFATERATELPEDVRERIVVPMNVAGQAREWRGTQWSLLWHKGHVFGARAVCCALLSLEYWLYQLQDAKKPLDAYLAAILEQSRSIALAGVLINVGKRDPDLFLGPLQPMVEAVDLHWMERHLRARSEDTYMACNFDPFGAERELVQKWVGMPHRQELMGDLVLRLFLSKPPWRAMLGEIAPRWQTRLDAGTPEKPAPDLLASTLAQFNLKNWEARQRNGRVEIAYTPPAGLPGPTEEERAQMERTQLLLFLPLECRRVLHGEIACNETKIAEWWALLVRIKELTIPDDQGGLRCHEDALLGIAGVAVVHHRSWLAADPGRESEARRLLIGTGQNQPKRFWFTEDDICDYRWDNFAAWGLATLWCENPADPLLRQAVGALVMWDRYLVVERVMLIAGANRAKLGVHFERLLAHAVRYAPLRYRVQADRHRQEKSFDHRKVLTRHLDEFVRNKTKLLPAKWVDLVEPAPKQKRRARGIDIMQLVITLSWAKDLAAAREQGERTQWLELHRQALSCALLRIQHYARTVEQEEDDSRDSFRDRWPFKDEERLLKRVGRMVARLPIGDTPRSLWEPLYAVGTPAEHWIERFNGTWFIEAAGGEQIQPDFAKQWAEFLAYGMNSPAWRESGRRYGSPTELTEDLLGMRLLGASFWRAELAPALETVRAHHETWARQHVGNSYHARRYLYFLGYAAARNLRLVGLKILHQLVPLNERGFWRDDEIAEAFGRFLRILLTDNLAEIAGDPAAREAFLAFALKLSALQHPLGQELLAAAGSRLTGPAATPR